MASHMAMVALRSKVSAEVDAERERGPMLVCWKKMTWLRLVGRQQMTPSASEFCTVMLCGAELQLWWSMTA